MDPMPAGQSGRAITTGELSHHNRHNETDIMKTIDAHLDRPLIKPAFRPVRLLLAAYLGISALALVAIVVLRDNPDLVNDAVWVRATLVFASSVLPLRFAARAADGFRRGYLRLRIVSAVMVVAIVVIVSLPGLFPLWIRIEQGACGIVLATVVVIVNSARIRSLFASE